MNNYYWPTYRNLEKEVLELSNYIHFSDEQLNVYSLYIANLIVRCAIEIESLSKELYSTNGGNTHPIDQNGHPRDLFFDTDCIEFLDKNFLITKKRVNVIASNFYFEKEENKNIAPLKKANKRGTSGSQWKQAYQGIKHDRKNGIKKATLKNLVNALGALYILNVYYKYTEPIVIGKGVNTYNVNNPIDTDIFSSTLYDVTFVGSALHMNDDSIRHFDKDKYEKAILIKKITDKSFISLHNTYCSETKEAHINLTNSKEIQDFLNTHPDYRNKSIKEICNAVGGEELESKIAPYTRTLLSRAHQYVELKLNKNTTIYPDLEQI